MNADELKIEETEKQEIREDCEVIDYFDEPVFIKMHIHGIV